MSGLTTRQKVMLGVIGALGVGVLGDRAGLLRASAEEGGSARERYLAESALLLKSKALLEQRGAWAQALSQAEERWAEFRGRVIEAESIDIAQGRLRDEVNLVAQSLGLPTPTAAPLPPRDPAPGGRAVANSGLKIVGLRVEFSAERPVDVFMFIDRLENLPALATGLTRIELKGPGAAQVPEWVDVIIEVRAPATLTAGGGSG